MSAPSFIANFDSAAAMALANARYLDGQSFDALGQPAPLKPPVKATGWLPSRAKEKVFITSGAFETITPRRVHRIDFTEVGEWLSEIYPPGPYPAVAVGASNGALTHLYTALGIPWLPQTMLVPVRQRVHPDDPADAMEKARRYGHKMMEHLPDLQLHHMHDASQDRLMVRALTYFRVKRRVLGADYERFLRERLQPGGTIIVPDCRLTWRTTRMGERYVFQHGAPDGLTEEEYHHGSRRVADYLARHDSPVRRWHGPELDDETPEAEWGFERALLDDIERFARENGYRILRITYERPSDTSPMVADLYRWRNAARRVPANRLMVSSFVVMEPYWTMRTGAVPFWMKFNSEPSLRELDEYLREAPPYDEIYLMLFQHGVESPGLPSKRDWQRVLRHASRRGTTLGADLDDFPRDFAHFARYDGVIQREIASRYPLPPPLPLNDFTRFLDEHGDRYDLTWDDTGPPGAGQAREGTLQPSAP
ncbi:hypothetical protein [Phytoactinopolyspora mesophila]|uniref:hypothetical protein n=1 Tax=Phytoactinopolyspora mesophila TaxID=2650750 RepID=UPI0016527819|nr:hypothetical protein [Phytoactinopolyspora mesophila]